MTLSDKEPRATTAIALTEVQLARISESRFLYMVQETPHFAIQVMRLMADRLRRTLGRL